MARGVYILSKDPPRVGQSHGWEGLGKDPAWPQARGLVFLLSHVHGGTLRGSAFEPGLPGHCEGSFAKEESRTHFL